MILMQNITIKNKLSEFSMIFTILIDFICSKMGWKNMKQKICITKSVAQVVLSSVYIKKWFLSSGAQPKRILGRNKKKKKGKMYSNIDNVWYIIDIDIIIFWSVAFWQNLSIFWAILMNNKTILYFFNK